MRRRRRLDGVDRIEPTTRRVEHAHEVSQDDRAESYTPTQKAGEHAAAPMAATTRVERACQGVR